MLRRTFIQVVSSAISLTTISCGGSADEDRRPVKVSQDRSFNYMTLLRLKRIVKNNSKASLEIVLERWREVFAEMRASFVPNQMRDFFTSTYRQEITNLADFLAKQQHSRIINGEVKYAKFTSFIID